MAKNPFWAEVDRIEEDLRPDVRALAVRGRRFTAAYFPALVTALLAGSSHLTLGLILSTSLSVAVTVAGELDPSIPWSVIVQKLDVARWRDPVVTPPPKRPTP